MKNIPLVLFLISAFAGILNGVLFNFHNVSLLVLNWFMLGLATGWIAAIKLVIKEEER